MWLWDTWVPLLILGTLFIASDARRVRVQPEEQEDETVQYYAAAEPEDEGRIVLVSADRYNGYYGQPTASSRSAQDNYIPSSRASAASSKAQAASLRTKEQNKAPPVQTIRNYNKVNDDGSFTFGYEAADGSFKEETRGTDCVVRGKYGYVDPDGNKREFTYVSGNPCDPNAPKEEESVEESAEREANEPENVPPNYPTRPIRPISRPTAAPRPVTFFQNNYAQQQEEEEQPEPEQVLRPQNVQPVRPRPYITRPQYESDSEDELQLYSRPTIVPSTTPASVLYKQSVTPISITPRPAIASSTARADLPATTYRPQLLQVAVTPKTTLYTKQFSPAQSRVPSSTQSPLLRGSPGNVDFEREFQKFQQENNLVSPTPSAPVKPTPRIVKPAAAPGPQSPTGQVYSSALVYDPSTGQYNTQLYQTLPQTVGGEISLNQRIQPYVAQPQLQRQVYSVPQSSVYRPAAASPQALYQQQQAELQFQNSAQLYAQQQRARTQQQAPSSPQSFYYVQPSGAPLSGGQIDAFLRGHNIQF